MVPVRGGMVTGNGQRHPDFFSIFPELSRLHRGEIVGFVLIAVDREMVKADPGQAGKNLIPFSFRVFLSRVTSRVTVRE